MASTCLPDIWRWIRNLPSTNQWNTNTISLCICSSESTSRSLNLSVIKSLHRQTPQVTFSIFAGFHMPIYLWTSNSFRLNTKVQEYFDEDFITRLFCSIINSVLRYGSNKKSPIRQPAMQISVDSSDIFNLAFLNLTFLVCLYELRRDLRAEFTDSLRLQLASSRSQEASKLLMRALGSNLEEKWMRSISLGITNWMMELQASNSPFTSPSALFSYASSESRLWKVQLYCPMAAMSIEDSSTTTPDDRLDFSLKYQQFEGVIQLAYKIIFRPSWIEVSVSVDNIRCDVCPLVSDSLMTRRGYGPEEKHFPSRITLQLTPTLQSDVLSVSVSKSTDNPIQEISTGTSLQGSFEPPKALGLSVTAAETFTMSMKPWRFEQSVHGNSAILNWFLHGGINGREIFSSKPSKLMLFRPKAWFRNRYSKASRPFTRQGGVIFAGDEYGESVRWKVSEEALGKTMEWELRGRIWLSYWPNKQRTFHSEIRGLEFRELLYLSLDK
ncbi:uncharacterized protein LOC103714371 [Phoenix dactylifera]|uniref:Uncharacterized protein LOC103714371 n=1 Tax=Phoenix dactylifera TaxID=42345 RepID=A0A8B7CI92_PHODC|nr:uncharacterized protein LOC103714371 [Phoenix dactylifera]